MLVALVVTSSSSACDKYSHHEKCKVIGEPELSGKSPKATKVLDKTQGAGDTEQGAEEPAANTSSCMHLRAQSSGRLIPRKKHMHFIPLVSGWA